MSVALNPTNVQTAETYSACGQWYHSSLCQFSKDAFAQGEYFWSYAGKVVLICRNLLNAAAKMNCIVSLVGEDFPHKVKNITTQMKLLSIVSVPFSLADISSTSQKIFKSFLIDDKEGIALGMLSLAIIAADAFDSATTFINSALTIAGINPIDFISSMGLPLGCAIAGMGTISRTIQITKTYFLYRKINSEILQNSNDGNRVILKGFLKNTLGTDKVKNFTKSIGFNQIDQTANEKIGKLKEQMKAAILRAAPNEIVLELEKLLKALKLKETVDGEIIKSLNTIQEQLRKKMRIDGLGIFANAIVLCALVLFYVGIASALPFLLLASAFSLRIISLAYQNFNNKTV